MLYLPLRREHNAGGNSDESTDEDPHRLRRIVASEKRRLLEAGQATDRANAITRKRSDDQKAADLAVANLDLTAEELQELVDLGYEFAWQKPLSRA